jgi:hypothetical protein
MRATAIAVCTLTALLSSGASAAETSLSMTSQPGDFVGQGQSYLFTTADGAFGASASADTVEISFHTPAFEHFFTLDFSASPNPLLPGSYAGAQRYPFEVNAPGLSVFGDGRGCNTLTGSFEVKEITTDGTGALTSFWATFEQHCEGGAPALFGDLRFRVPDARSFFSLAPCRVLDTRAPSGGPALAAGERRAVTVAGACGVPLSARAIAANLTATSAVAPGFLRLFAGDLTSPPSTSTLNFRPGKTRANSAIVTLASDGSGKVVVENGSGGTVQVILDVSGYFE